jgi:hypothetical protein
MTFPGTREAIAQLRRRLLRCQDCSLNSGWKFATHVQPGVALEEDIPYAVALHE